MDVAVPVPDQRLAAAPLVSRVAGAGRGVYAVAVAGIGALLLSNQFAYVWAPIPRGVPSRELLTAAAGGLMLLAAAGLAWRRAVVPSSAILATSFLGWLLLLQVPRIVAAPSKELLWAGASQLASLVAGGWILFATAASRTGRPGRWIGDAGGIWLARRLYALALPLFGFHHIADVAAAAAAVPGWLPFRPGWVYLTGAGHVAAGVAILLGIVPRLAATLEALMIGAFVLLIHVPGVIGAPGDALQWTMLLVAAAIGGATWIVAGSYGGPDGPDRAAGAPVAPPTSWPDR